MSTNKQQVKAPAPVVTACRDCLFSVWNDRTQVGCKIDGPNKFKKNGLQVIDACDEHDMNFFVIEGKRCRFYTDSNPQKIPIDSLLAKTKEEKEIRATVITNVPLVVSNKYVRETFILANKLIPELVQQPKHNVTVPFDNDTSLKALLELGTRQASKVDKTEFILVSTADVTGYLPALQNVDKIINTQLKNVMAVYDDSCILLYSSLFKHIALEQAKSISDIGEIINSHCATKAVYTWKEMQQL